MSPRVYSACSPLHTANSKSIDAAALWCARARQSSLVLYPHVTTPPWSPSHGRLLLCNLQHDVTLVYEKTRWATLRRKPRRRRTRDERRDAAQSEQQGAWHKAIFPLTLLPLLSPSPPPFSFASSTRLLPLLSSLFVRLSGLFLSFPLPVYKHA